MVISYKIIKEIYLAISITLLVLIGLEVLQTGMVRAYINLSYFLIFWLIIAIILVYYKKK